MQTIFEDSCNKNCSKSTKNFKDNSKMVLKKAKNLILLNPYLNTLSARKHRLCSERALPV